MMFRIYVGDDIWTPVELVFNYTFHNWRKGGGPSHFQNAPPPSPRHPFSSSLLVVPSSPPSYLFSFHKYHYQRASKQNNS